MDGGWRKLHNEEICNFYSSLNIIRMIKSRRMRLTRHVTRKGIRGMQYRILVGNPEVPPGRPTRRWKIILKWITEKQDGIAWTYLIWLRIGTSGWLL
jgi:hypothetical protein